MPGTETLKKCPKCGHWQWELDDEACEIGGLEDHTYIINGFKGIQESKLIPIKCKKCGKELLLKYPRSCTITEQGGKDG